jgi:hypothetical protein
MEDKNFRNSRVMRKDVYRGGDRYFIKRMFYTKVGLDHVQP